ncbi:hypothetical protein CPAR01_09845 [Colletotrichum paranaense]|uniref:Fe2OG dioxygenase domain-containing protein n=1 Tax=Colletotrichum paranaense TaxID=1914294 RepID=A0ABQ9SCA8_9PEZI|nr:uncharacterized protein CPAR01_09845 [Colletotrichum paranaense]KAK1533137.1 hypothetical protein CPAR01_09845 [Colletotrichum paranaense]
MPIPSIDFSAVFASDAGAKKILVEQLEAACRSHGFFQLTGHGIPQSLLDAALDQSKELFSLPLEVKEKYDKNLGGFNRGYERLRSQNFEALAQGDLKEGYYFGKDLRIDNPKVLERKFNLGPNKYPKDVTDPVQFRKVIDDYHAAMCVLAEIIIRTLCATIGNDDDWVSDFIDTPIAVLRLLHYPPQAPNASATERGIGAHTDFGAITILLQDMVGGLQVWDRASSEWIDVKPTEGALVVNLGNLMMRWTNDRYLSNLHRVINKSGRERYSIPFFFSGNPDFVVECFSKCRGDAGPKYPPVTVGEWISGRYADTYGTSKDDAFTELSSIDPSAASAYKPKE